MKTNEIIDKVIFYKDRDRLDRTTRQRDIVYKRAYLMHVLRCQLVTFNEIATTFNVTHCTVIYHCNMVKRCLIETRDEIYISYIQEYLKAFEGEKYLPEYWDLEYDIVNCSNTYQLKLIQERIKEKKYQINATILKV